MTGPTPNARPMARSAAALLLASLLLVVAACGGGEPDLCADIPGAPLPAGVTIGPTPAGPINDSPMRACSAGEVHSTESK